MRVERVGEVVGQGICGGDGAGHPAGGYCASMGDDWRVRIAFDEDDPPDLPESGEQALVAALRSRLSDQVAVTSNGTDILYAPAAGSADEAAQVARQVLARHDVSASVRTEFWSSLKEEWRDVTDEPSADPVAERRAVNVAEDRLSRLAGAGRSAVTPRCGSAGRVSCRPGMAGTPAPQAPARRGGLRRRR
jgi:hypothetical protein